MLLNGLCLPGATVLFEERVDREYFVVSDEYEEAEDEYSVVEEPLERVSVESYQYFPGSDRLLAQLPYAGFVFQYRGRWYISHIPGHPVYRVEFKCKPPPEYSYIEITGYGYRYNPLGSGNRYDKIILVYAWKQSTPPRVNVEEHISFKEYLNEISDGLELIGGKAHLLLAYTLLGSPLIDLGKERIIGGSRLVAVGEQASRLSKILQNIWGTTPPPFKLLRNKIYRKVITKTTSYLEKNAYKTYTGITRVKSPVEALIRVLKASPRRREELLDTVKYTLAKKIIYPVAITPEALEYASKLSLELRGEIERLNPPRIIYGQGKPLDPNYTGSPLAIIRVAMGIARAYNETSIDWGKLREAYSLVIKALEEYITQLPSGAGREIPLSSKMREVLRIISERECISIQELYSETSRFANKRDVDKILGSLLERGFVYAPNPSRICILEY